VTVTCWSSFESLSPSNVTIVERAGPRMWSSDSQPCAGLQDNR